MLIFKKIVHIILLLVVVLNCHKYSPTEPKVELTVFPEVRMSDFNYDDTGIELTFWNDSTWRSFTHAYNGKFSSELVELIVDNMRKQAEALFLDPDVLDSCIYGNPEMQGNASVFLPCVAERAKYQGQDVWVIIFAWGFDVDDLGHIWIHVMDLYAYKSLHYLKCR